MVVWEMVKVMFKNHELTVSKGGEEAARDLVEKAARVAAAGVVVDTKLTEARDFAQDTFNTELDTAFNALKIVNLEGVDTRSQNTKNHSKTADFGYGRKILHKVRRSGMLLEVWKILI